MPAPEEQAALRDQCTVFLAGHGPVRAADLLAGIPSGTAARLVASVLGDPSRAI